MAQTYDPGVRPLAARLYEIALTSPAPAAMAAFYSASLGYSFEERGDRQLGVARHRRLQIAPGPANTLLHAAFAVDDARDLAALAQRLTAALVATTQVDAPGFLPGALRFQDPDGNCFLFGLADDAAAPGAELVGQRSARLQHVVFATTNIERLVDFFMHTMGFRLSDRVSDEQGGLRTAFLRCSHEHHSIAIFSAPENRMDHHCYEARDWNEIRDWSDHFAQLRIPLKWGPGRHGPGNNLFVFIHDPDGGWVEVSAELEHVEPDRIAGEWPHEERTLNSWGIGLLRS